MKSPKDPPMPINTTQITANNKPQYKDKSPPNIQLNAS